MGEDWGSRRKKDSVRSGVGKGRPKNPAEVNHFPFDEASNKD